jgi:hypothetical protein
VVQPLRTGAEQILLTPVRAKDTLPSVPETHKPSRGTVLSTQNKEANNSNQSTSVQSEQADDRAAKASIPISSKRTLSIGDKLEECEEPVPNPLHLKNCGTLTWNGEKYDAIWTGVSDGVSPPGPATTATVAIERDGETGVTLNRIDISGTPGVTGIYRGTISQNNNASGTVTWFYAGKPYATGTWTAKP